VTLRRSDLARRAHQSTAGSIDPVGEAHSRPESVYAGSYPCSTGRLTSPDVTIRNSSSDRSSTCGNRKPLQIELEDEAVNQVRRAAPITWRTCSPAPARLPGRFQRFARLTDPGAVLRFREPVRGPSAPFRPLHLCTTASPTCTDHFVMTTGLDRYFKSGSPVTSTPTSRTAQPDPSSHRAPITIRSSSGSASRQRGQHRGAGRSGHGGSSGNGGTTIIVSYHRFLLRKKMINATSTTSMSPKAKG
jgi:hypothetical protein